MSLVDTLLELYGGRDVAELLASPMPASAIARSFREAFARAVAEDEGPVREWHARKAPR